LSTSRSDKAIRYKMNDRDFYIDDTGIVLSISDFGLSNIAYYPQYTNFEARYHQNDNTGMGCTINRYADAFRIVQTIMYLLRYEVDAETMSFFERVFTVEPKLRDNAYLTVKDDFEYLTMKTVLKDEYFNTLTVKRSYDKYYNMDFKSKIKFAPIREQPLDLKAACKFYRVPLFIDSDPTRVMCKTRPDRPIKTIDRGILTTNLNFYLSRIGLKSPKYLPSIAFRILSFIIERFDISDTYFELLYLYVIDKVLYSRYKIHLVNNTDIPNMYQWIDFASQLDLLFANKRLVSIADDRLVKILTFFKNE